MTITSKIIKVLKQAGSVKDKIEPLCSRDLNYPTKKAALYMCIKCYPSQKIKWK